MAFTCTIMNADFTEAVIVYTLLGRDRSDNQRFICSGRLPVSEKAAPLQGYFEMASRRKSNIHRVSVESMNLLKKISNRKRAVARRMK